MVGGDEYTVGADHGRGGQGNGGGGQPFGAQRFDIRIVEADDCFAA
jgi:hypothetical protein